MDAGLSRGYYQLNQHKSSVDAPIQVLPGRPVLYPKDRYGLIYISLVMAGVGFLLPYNSFITAVDYLHAKYPGTTIVFDMTMTYICVAFVSVLVNNILVETFRLETRITFGYVISFGTLLVVAVFDVAMELFPREASYKMNLVAVATVALGCTVQQSSFYGYTSMLPQRYRQAVMTGESAAGLMISISRIVTKLMLRDEKLNTLLFFIISIVIVVVCCLTFIVSRRSDFVKFYLTLCENAGIGEDQQAITVAPNQEEVGLVDMVDSRHQRTDTYGVLQIGSPTTMSPRYTASSLDTTPGSTSNAVSLDNQSSSILPSSPPAVPEAVVISPEATTAGYTYKKNITLGSALKKGLLMRRYASGEVWPYMLSIAIAYFVTLCLFPGIESEIVSCKWGSWMPIILMAVFNLFDFLGKIISAVPYDWPRRKLVWCTSARVVLVPLLIFCTVPRESPYLPGEFWPLLLSGLLGISNGYFGSVPMILAGAKVPDERKELAGNIMTLAYTFGLVSGSAVSYFIDFTLGTHSTMPDCGLHINGTIAPLIMNDTDSVEYLSDL